MRVRMRACLVGPDEQYMPGKIYDLPDPVAHAWIAIGHCVAEPGGDDAPALSGKTVEEATAGPRETAVSRRVRSRKR